MKKCLFYVSLAVLFFSCVFADAYEINVSNLGVGISGEAEGDRVGVRICRLGDINGDGFSDFAVTSEHNEGEIGIFFGKSDWSGTPVFSNADVIIGFPSSGQMSGEGDINGDGINDISVVLRDDESDLYTLYIIFGRKSNEWTTNTSIDVLADAYICTAKDIDIGSVSIDGDVNGDGVDDLVFLTREYISSSYSYNKNLVVFFGSKDRWSSNMSYGEGDFVYNDPSLRNRDGVTFADMNSDGYSEIIAVIQIETTNGSYYNDLLMVYLQNGIWMQKKLLNTEPSGGNSWWYSNPVGIGDINNDGYEDILYSIAVPYADSPYILMGCSDILTKEEMTTASIYLPDVQYPPSGIGYGHYAYRDIASISGRYDINRDGICDFAFNCSEYAPIDSVMYINNRTYVFFGKADIENSFVSDITIYSADTFYSEQTYSTSSSIAGDINLDGQPDILFGDSFCDSVDANDIGGVYLISNLIINPSADQGTNGWKTYGTTQIKETEDNNYFSLPVEGGYFRQDITIPAGRTKYKISSDVRCSNASAREGSPCITVYLMDSSNKIVKSFSTSAQDTFSDEWITINKEYEVSSEDATRITKIRIFLKRSTVKNVNDENVADFDDVSITLG